MEAKRIALTVTQSDAEALKRGKVPDQHMWAGQVVQQHWVPQSGCRAVK